MPYESLYCYGQDRSYCSVRSCDPGEQCESGVYPCVGTPYPIKHTRTLTGFKNIYNMNEARNVCGIEYADPSECGQDEATLYLHLSTLPRYKQPADMAAFPGSFRIFIPPGTVYAGANVYFPINALEGLILRYKQPPDGIFLRYAWKSGGYNIIPWDVDTYLTLDETARRDVYVPNAGGSTHVVTPFALYTPLAPEDSGWLYIQKLPFSSDTIHDVKVTIRVNLDAYQEWYNRVSYVGSKYYWDGNGNPYVRDQGEIGSLNMMAKYAGQNWENSPPVDSDYASILSLVGNDPSKHVEGIYNGIYYYFGNHPEKCMAIKYLEQITNGCWYLWIKNYGGIKLDDCKVYFDF